MQRTGFDCSFRISQQRAWLPQLLNLAVSVNGVFRTRKATGQSWQSENTFWWSILFWGKHGCVQVMESSGNTILYRMSEWTGQIFRIRERGRNRFSLTTRAPLLSNSLFFYSPHSKCIGEIVFACDLCNSNLHHLHELLHSSSYP